MLYFKCDPPVHFTLPLRCCMFLQAIVTILTIIINMILMPPLTIWWVGLLIVLVLSIIINIMQKFDDVNALPLMYYPGFENQLY